ncbi:hypothetical protein KVR01_009075 [Diaporthe batatas]|uniref:uncharacterized protein n=1 Tax=Diaporthe batatas TaxID=748121 RepID=UPI001D047574|nr:uncharacterized protein KVR01_009075 [Diaporthe batatas]KAG8160811.1 hypothetical protein KVR01_009075 [Diaporthe batatas]
MLSLYLFTSTLALGLATAAPAETRQGPTINVQLKHSRLDVVKTLDNVPLDDFPVPVDPAFLGDIVNAECDGGCKIGFHCTLYGQNENAKIEVGPGETKFIFDAFATITAVSCAPGLPAPPEEKRQDEGEGGLVVQFTNHPLEVTETIRLDADGQPRTVNFDFTVSVVSTGCAEICIPELAYHCQLFDRALKPIGNLTGPGSLRFPEGQQPFIGQITCYDDFGRDAVVHERAVQHTKARQVVQGAVQGTVIFTNEEGDRYEHELVLDELVVLPDNVLPVFYTEATVILLNDPHDRFWGCRAFAHGRAAFDDLGMFYANTRFEKTFEGGEIHWWKCE